jgi:hypothetical protein
MHTTEEIKAAIAGFPDLTEEQLINNFKIITSMTTKKEKDLYAPALRAIEKERRKRGTIKTISAKPTQPRVTQGSSADDYEAVEITHDD